MGKQSNMHHIFEGVKHILFTHLKVLCYLTRFLKKVHKMC